MSTIKNTKKQTIYQDLFNINEIKKLEDLSETIRKENSLWWEKSSESQKHIRDVYDCRIVQYFRETAPKIKESKKDYNKAQHNSGNIIRLASDAYKSDHGDYYGRGFSCFSFGALGRYVTEEEKEIVIIKNKICYKLYKLQDEFRVKHIAWSLFKGRKFKEIMPNCRNFSSHDYDEIKKEILKIQKTLCPSEKS